MSSNQLVINKVKELYLKHLGRNHRQIEREMHDLGYLTFTRRSLYNQKTKTGCRLGWIEKYGWKQELMAATDALVREHAALQLQSARVSSSTKTSANMEAPSPPHLRASVVDPDPSDFRSWLKRVSPNMTWDWKYQQIIYDQLQRVTSGECRRLMIFLPPRHGKSELVTNRYAAWRLLNNPDMNIIIGSYNQRLQIASHARSALPSKTLSKLIMEN